jgi:hypothetical protein
VSAAFAAGLAAGTSASACVVTIATSPHAGLRLAAWLCLGVMCVLLFAAGADATPQETPQPGQAVKPDALADARERIRDLVTMEVRLGRWVDEYGIGYGTDAAVSAQRAMTRVQNAVRDMQDCTGHLETHLARRQAGGEA